MAAALRLGLRATPQAGSTRLHARLSTSLSMSEAYALLGLRPGATSEQVKKAYRSLAKQHHPDVAGTGDGELFKRITTAYSQALLDSTREDSSACPGSSYGPGRRRRDGWEEYSRPPPRPRTSSDNFNHKEWDEAHYGVEREAQQSAYVRGLHRHARGAGGFAYATSAPDRGRQGESDKNRQEQPGSFLNVLLSAGALWTVYHVLYSSHFGLLREEHKLLEAKHLASKQSGRRQ